MNKKRLLGFGVVLLLAFVGVSILRKDAPRLYHISGLTMGTISYNIKYIDRYHETLDAEVERLLVDFNQSLSTYIPDSEISMLNKSGSLSFQSDFMLPVLQVSKEVYVQTNGAFDPSIGPLVNAWGFGSSEREADLDSLLVDSLMQRVGFNHVTFTQDSVYFTTPISLDFSAIAKGYAVDLIADLLDEKGVMNYLVEIGGEVRAKGTNDQEKVWSLGIEDPMVNANEQKLLAIVRLKDQALATSGNYRNYYEKEGRIYTHILDPRTGYSATHNLLSASVFAKDCMTADAYATACMVMGLEPSKQLADMQDIDVFLVYLDTDGKISSYASDGLVPFLEMNRAQ